MKIAGYIGDLLYEYECVVIPGLGGFLTRDHSASIHPVRHYLKPPHREIVFNPLLRTNDGLLLSHIARSEKLSYQEAKGKIDRFVLKCLSMMEEGKRIHFRQIGYICFNDEKEIVFQPDENMNYLPDSFGLTGIVSPPIKREEFQQKIETVFNRPPKPRANELPLEENQVPPIRESKTTHQKQRMVASRRKSNYRRQFTILAAAVILMLLAIGYMNKHIVQQYYRDYAAYTSVLPLFYGSPNEYIIKNKDRLPVDQLIMLEDNAVLDGAPAKPTLNDLKQADVYKAELSVVPEITNNMAANDQEVAVQTDSTDWLVENKESEVPESAEGNDDMPAENPLSQSNMESVQAIMPESKFFIIAGAFRERKNADKLIGELRMKGFNADYVGQTNSGLWRVCFDAFVDQSAALQRLQSIKKSENANAWILEL